MTFPSVSLRLLIGGLAVFSLGSPLGARALPRQLSEQDLESLNQRFLDSVVVIAGDQIITRRDLTQHLGAQNWRDRYLEASQLPEDQANQAITKVENDATADLVEAFLEVRAGEDRGFDPEIMELVVDQRFDRIQESEGGYQAFSRKLAASNSNPKQYKQTIRRSLYRYYWQGAVTGRQPGTTGRRELDRYVRPGEIRGTYRSFLKSPRLAEVELTGFREAQFEVQELALGFQALGGREAALERAEKLHTDLTKGTVSFEELISYWSKTDKDAREKSTSTFSLSIAARISQATFGGPALFDFVREGEVGEMSTPLESNGAVHLFLITRIEDEQPSKPLATLEVQEAIRKHLTDRQNRNRLGRAHLKLIQESQLQPKELAQYMLRPEWLLRDPDAK